MKHGCPKTNSSMHGNRLADLTSVNFEPASNYCPPPPPSKVTIEALAKMEALYAPRMNSGIAIGFLKHINIPPQNEIMLVVPGQFACPSSPFSSVSLVDLTITRDDSGQAQFEFVDIAHLDRQHLELLDGKDVVGFVTKAPNGGILTSLVRNLTLPQDTSLSS